MVMKSNPDQATFRIHPPIGCAFAVNADGSINLTFHFKDVDRVDEWALEMARVAKDACRIHRERAEANSSPLDKPVTIADSVDVKKKPTDQIESATVGAPRT